jgi:PIN domain nuclease of toxin-antitoxin system
MTEIVVDSSIVLAIINREAGFPAAEAALSDSLISTVNLSEVVAKLLKDGVRPADAEEMMGRFPCRRVDFGQRQAFVAGALRATTSHKGLSLGDRACLALAITTGLPVLTADRAWTELDLGVDVRLIR